MDRNDKDYFSFLLGIILLPFILVLFDDLWKLLVSLAVVAGVLITSGFGVYYLLS